MIKKILIICGLTIVGGASATGTILVLENLERNGDTVLVDPVPRGIVMMILGPIGTLITGARWLYWALDSRGGP